MHCKFCGFANHEDDHRCQRCGRRIGMAIAAPQGYAGATALALASSVETAADPEPVSLQAPAQPALFPALASSPASHSNVISFVDIQRQAGIKPAAAPASGPSTFRQSVAPTPRRSGSATAAAGLPQQESLEFVASSGQKARTLKTEVEAVIFCDQPVATPMHRFVAAAIDASLILIGFGLFVTLALLLGGNFGEGKIFWITMAACFIAISLFYGSIWTVLGIETVGMRATELQLITFDGFPVEGSARLLRFGATWLSFCSAGLGVLWSLADEENLTWHDHISKTFPTLREIPRNFVRERR